MESILSVAGITLNMVGVCLIFWFGLSPLIGTDSTVFLFSNKELADRDSWANRKKRIYWRLSVTGLVLCIVGSLLQIISVFF